MGSEPIPLLEADEADSYQAFNRNPYTGIVNLIFKRIYYGQGTYR